MIARLLCALGFHQWNYDVSVYVWWVAVCRRCGGIRG